MAFTETFSSAFSAQWQSLGRTVLIAAACGAVLSLLAFYVVSKQKKRRLQWKDVVPVIAAVFAAVLCLPAQIALAQAMGELRFRPAIEEEVIASRTVGVETTTGITTTAVVVVDKKAAIAALGESSTLTAATTEIPMTATTAKPTTAAAPTAAATTTKATTTTTTTTTTATTTAVKTTAATIPIDLDTLFAQGVRQLENNRYRDAGQTYLQYLALRPNDPAGWHNLGVAYLMNGQAANAVEAFTLALNYNPDRGSKWYSTSGRTAAYYMVDKTAEGDADLFNFSGTLASSKYGTAGLEFSGVSPGGTSWNQTVYYFTDNPQ